jgi:integrase
MLVAHIQFRPEKTKPYRAIIHRKGLKAYSKSFTERKHAESWARKEEISIETIGMPKTIDDLKQQTVADIVNRYLVEITPSKGCHVSETTVLKKFIREDPGKSMAKKSLAYVSKQDAYTYINARLKEVKASTVARERNSIQHVFEVARDEWGLTNLVNPFSGAKIRGKTMNRRKRQLNEGELEKIEYHAQRCKHKEHVLLAVYLAIETGMRLQEIFNLKWGDIDLTKRRIEIRKSKTDYISATEGRTIVLPFLAWIVLTRAVLMTLMTEKESVSVPVFPMTKEAFKQTWGHVLKSAGISGLTFHDLRREAGTWFDAAGLTKTEHELMMGHKPKDITGTYINAHLNSILDKLDKHRTGITPKEMDEFSKNRGGLPEMTRTAAERFAKDWRDARKEQKNNTY